MAGRGSYRGRIVMLVDNGVIGDSRVQKQAESAANRGWEVFLLGKGKSAKRWRIGKARVILLPFDASLGRRPHESRPGQLRHPMAYRNRKLARQKVAAAQAEKQILDALIARAKQQKNPVRAGLFTVARRAKGAQSRWTDARARTTDQVAEARRSMSAPLDRFTTGFLRRVYGGRAWRKLDPELLVYETLYAPEIDRLRPDIIHANDFRMLGVGARATARARAAGRDVKLVWDAHEFLPGLKPWSSHPRWHIAQILHEQEFAQYADAVITVTEPLAELLQEAHELREPPTVVLNTPITGDQVSGSDRNLRDEIGLSPSAPLLVYAGAAAPQRGLDTMVDALPNLPDVHVAFVVQMPMNEYVEGLVERAEALGCADRLHVVGYVPVNEIVPFLSSATVGVMPAHKWLNHEISLATKFFEYSHARLPIVTSNLKAMAAMVEETGQGEVFLAEDTEDYVRAVTKVLADTESYRRAYDDTDRMDSWSWERQAELLDAVYARLRAQQTPVQG